MTPALTLMRVLKGMNRIAAQTNSDVFSNFTSIG